MDINLDPNMFRVVEQDNLRLITPTHAGAVANAPWSKDTLKYRSRVETLEGEPVSLGFNKFFNLGIAPDGLNTTLDDIASYARLGDAVATMKVDGTLLIRSVWEGEVMLRTRGSFGYKHLGNAGEMDYFKGIYPKLFNHLHYPSISLLFEWVSPMNTIVIKYDKPGLTLIGAVDHTYGRYLRIDELKPIARFLGAPLVIHFPLSVEGWRELSKELKFRHDIEGYVIRVNGEQELVKVKCPPYITKHALKSTLTTEGLADLYFLWGEPAFLGLCHKFKTTYDEETCLWALGAISALYDGINEFKRIMYHMKGNAKKREALSRREAAELGIGEYGKTKRFSAYMQIWEDKKEVDLNLRKSILLQVTKQFELEMFKAPGDYEGTNWEEDVIKTEFQPEQVDGGGVDDDGTDTNLVSGSGSNLD